MFLIAVVASAAVAAPAPMISRPVAPVSRPAVMASGSTTTHARPQSPNLSYLYGHRPQGNAFDCYRLAIVQQTQGACPRLYLVP
jgi:hypothetical protein